MKTKTIKYTGSRKAGNEKRVDERKLKKRDKSNIFAILKDITLLLKKHERKN